MKFQRVVKGLSLRLCSGPRCDFERGQKKLLRADTTAELRRTRGRTRAQGREVRPVRRCSGRAVDITLPYSRSMAADEYNSAPQQSETSDWPVSTAGPWQKCKLPIAKARGIAYAQRREFLRSPCAAGRRALQAQRSTTERCRLVSPLPLSHAST